MPAVDSDLAEVARSLAVTVAVLGAPAWPPQVTIDTVLVVVGVVVVVVRVWPPAGWNVASGGKVDSRLL